MIQAPKRIRYKKVQKGRVRGFELKGTNILQGNLALRALETCLLTTRQLEALRKAVIRKIKKNGSLWVRVFPDRPVTKKPSEVRMGSGKGAVDHWVVPVKPNKIILEVNCKQEHVAREALKYGSFKLPIRTEIVSLTS